MCSTWWRAGRPPAGTSGRLVGWPRVTAGRSAWSPPRPGASSSTRRRWRARPATRCAAATRSPTTRTCCPPPTALLVGPATFNTINKWAAGIADTLALGLLQSRARARACRSSRCPSPTPRWPPTRPSGPAWRGCATGRSPSSSTTTSSPAPRAGHRRAGAAPLPLGRRRGRAAEPNVPAAPGVLTAGRDPGVTGPATGHGPGVCPVGWRGRAAARCAAHAGKLSRRETTGFRQPPSPTWWPLSNGASRRPGPSRGTGSGSCSASRTRR